MKANEAPERIYLDSRKAWQKTFYDYFTIKAKANDIEYTRTDAFIDKACGWMDEHCKLLTSKDYEDFRKYMKGE